AVSDASRSRKPEPRRAAPSLRLAGGTSIERGWSPRPAMTPEPTAQLGHAERGGMRLAGLRWPWPALVSLASTATAWPAAGYGALVIGVAGDLRASGTLWIFGWPFLVLLAMATVLHQLAFGAGARWGIPAIFPGVRALDSAVRLSDAALDRATL